MQDTGFKHVSDEGLMDKYKLTYDEARDVRHKAELYDAEKLEGGSGHISDETKVPGEGGLNETLDSWEERDRSDNVRLKTGKESKRGVKDVFNENS